MLFMYSNNRYRYPSRRDFINVYELSGNENLNEIQLFSQIIDPSSRVTAFFATLENLLATANITALERIRAECLECEKHLLKLKQNPSICNEFCDVINDIFGMLSAGPAQAQSSLSYLHASMSAITPYLIWRCSSMNQRCIGRLSEQFQVRIIEYQISAEGRHNYLQIYNQTNKKQVSHLMSTVRILKLEGECYILYPFSCEQMDQISRTLFEKRRLESQNEQLLKRLNESLQLNSGREKEIQDLRGQVEELQKKGRRVNKLNIELKQQISDLKLQLQNVKKPHYLQVKPPQTKQHQKFGRQEQWNMDSVTLLNRNPHQAFDNNYCGNGQKGNNNFNSQKRPVSTHHTSGASTIAINRPRMKFLGIQDNVDTKQKRLCEVCGQETIPYSIFECAHYTCQVCLVQSVEAQVLRGKLPVCPYDKCGAKCASQGLQFLRNQKRKDLQSKLGELFLKSQFRDEICTCPKCHADLLVLNNQQFINCRCGNSFCCKCQQSHKSNQRCDEAELFQVVGGLDFPTVCPTCQRLYDKNEHCDHVICEDHCREVHPQGFCARCSILRSPTMAHDNSYHRSDCKFYDSPPNLAPAKRQAKCSECTKLPAGQICKKSQETFRDFILKNFSKEFQEQLSQKRQTYEKQKKP